MAPETIMDMSGGFQASAPKFKVTCCECKLLHVLDYGYDLPLLIVKQSFTVASMSTTQAKIA